MNANTKSLLLLGISVILLSGALTSNTQAFADEDDEDKDKGKDSTLTKLEKKCTKEFEKDTPQKYSPECQLYAQILALEGSTGATGPQGVTGPAGSNGAQGVTGPAGSNGAQGVTGPAGSNGAQGVTGPAGSNGAQGVTGPQGPPGVIAEQSCEAGLFMTGIDSSGNIVCTTP